ncbi:MAG: hypothetical protein RL095_827 [Verrucomicrobiota bacterium]|jgi:ferric-dicitrate binding protein FerR (iron transport regulator)
MSPELAILIEKCLAGEADEAEMASMEAQIHASDEAYREYLEQVNFLIDMRDASPPGRPVTRSSPPSRRPARRRVAPAGSRAWLPFALAASLLLAALLIFTGKKGAEPQFLVASLPRDASILRQGQAVRDDKLYAGDVLSSGHAEIDLQLPGERSEIRLDPSSRLRICPRPDFRLELQQGSFSASVAPQPRPFRIATPEAAVTILGTLFSLSHDAEGSLLTVKHGCVEMTAQGRSRKIYSGESLASRQMQPPETSAAVLIPMNSAGWRYSDDGQPGQGWQQPGFDDSTWKIGQCPFAYGENCRTPLTPGKITYCFRREFSLPAAISAESLEINMLYDDGVLLFVNGIEVLRRRLPPGRIDSNTLARSHEAKRLSHYTIPASGLKPGRNIIAVELHNRSPESTDIYLNMELKAKPPAQP